MQYESVNTSVGIDVNGMAWDLTEFPSKASGVTVSLGSLLATDYDPNGNAPLSASNSIYRVDRITRKYPCLIVQDSVVMGTNIPNIQTEMVSIYVFDEEQAGVEAIVRLGYLIKLLFNENIIYSNNLGFLNMKLVSETATRNILDYGYGKALNFRFTVSQFGDMV